MKQILQSLKTGCTEVAEVPRPAVKRGQLFDTVIAHAGICRHRAHAGGVWQGQLDRQSTPAARQGAHGARQIKTDGFMPTVEAVFNKLDQPLPLGYCNVGTVLEAGVGVSLWALYVGLSSATWRPCWT
jgi:hypothetical protein